MKTLLSDPLAGALRLIFVLLGLMLAGGPLAAQPVPDQPAPYKIGSIAVKFIGIANVSEQIVRANMQVKEGGDLDDTLVDRDIRTLYKTGLFEFIEVKREVLSDRVINLVVEVTPKYRVQDIKFQGNKNISSNRLRKQELEIKPNSPLDERQVKSDTQKIYNYYQKSGYSQVAVSYAIERNKATGFCTVIFKITEGNRVKISDIRFIGNTHAKPRTLRGVMETKRYWMFSWLTGSGRFKDDQFEDDIGKLLDYYREDGYLDVDIPMDKISYDYPTPAKLVITIRVDEGRQYRLGDIAFSGNKLYPTWLLRRVVKQKSGVVFTPSKIEKDAGDLEDFYGRSGYLETRVRIIRKPNVSTGNIDVEYNLIESDKYYVESIKIEGNTKTKSLVIIRELNLGPGEVFDMVRMKLSKLLLENTRFFDDVNMSPETTNIPGRRNLKIAVKEARTGNFSFGAGYNTVERASVFAEISQSNFDLFNSHSMFQGDGQKFRIRAQVGQLSSEYTLNFEEPWLFQKRLALGFQLYREASNYYSSIYQQVRTGVQVYLRKYLFGLVEGTLAYTFEVVNIYDVSPAASLTIFELSGQKTESKVSFTLLRDTRDKLVNTTQGSRAEFITTLAGGPLYGQSNYYSFEARGSQFYTLFDSKTQVLGLIARGGVTDSFGDNNKARALIVDGTPIILGGSPVIYTPGVPFYDRFFLGGPQDLRGFEYRMVGPKDSTDEPVGGKTYGFFSAEYTVEIVDPFRFAIFYDAGFVNTNAYDFNAANYNDDWGVGLRFIMLNAPISLDLGFPLTNDRVNKSGNQFNFSFGTRF